MTNFYFVLHYRQQENEDNHYPFYPHNKYAMEY